MDEPTKLGELPRPLQRVVNDEHKDPLTLVLLDGVEFFRALNALAGR